jgi:zinc protease
LDVIGHVAGDIGARVQTGLFEMDSARKTMPARISTLLVVIWTCSGFASRVHGEANDVPQLKIETYRLDNGLRVALSPDPTAPRTTISVTYHVGSKNERAGLTGFAHFFEHMMFRGTKNVPNFDKPLQQAGGSPNAFTTPDITLYFETVPRHYVERALFMEAERMAFLPSALDMAKFDTEREIVKNERRQRMENVPYGLAQETIASHLFPKGHPYSWSVIGSMTDLDTADLGDLRRFFYEFYHPGNATLTVVGSFDLASVKQWIDDYFGILRPGPEVSTVQAPDPPGVSRKVVQRDQVQFPRIYWTWPSIPQTDKDAAALAILADLLSDGDGSRLRRALVIDETWSTDVDASSDTREIAGMFSISATVAAGKAPEDVEEILAEQLEQLQANPPTQEEVSRAIRKDQKRSLLQLTDTTGRALAIGIGWAQYDDPHYYQTSYRDRANVTPQDVQRVATRYLTSDKLVLHVLPVSQGEEESEAILAGPLPSENVRPTIKPRDPRPGADWKKLPDPSTPVDFSPPNFETRKLSNGLDVWFAQWRTLPLVSAELVVPTGWPQDPGQKSGLEKLTARLWEKGTQDLSSTEFAEALDALGATLSVNSSSDTTELSFTVVKDSLPEALTLVGSMVVQPRFDQADFQREKTLQLSELARGPDDPGWIAERVFPRLLYGLEHPYGFPVDGFSDTVKSLTLDGVRKFYAERFVPTGATLIIAGDIDVKSVMPHIERTWGRWSGSAVSMDHPAAESARHVKRVYVVDKPGAVQSILRVGRLWRHRSDPSFLASQLGNRVLGGDFLSRINQNLRERNGFTYGVGSAFRYRREGSEWVVQTSVRANVTAAALKELMTEIEATRGDRPLSEAEIDGARTAELNTFPAQFESPPLIASSLAVLARHRLPKNYLQEVIQQVRSVDAQQAAEVIAQVCTRTELMALVVGDRSHVVPQLEQAGFDDLVFLNSDGIPFDPKNTE